MTRKTHLLAVAALAVAALGHGEVAGGDCSSTIGIDARIDDRMIVHVVDDSDIDTFIAAYLANNPMLEGLVVDEQIPGRKVYLLALDLPPNPDPLFLDALEADLAASYDGILRYGDFLYENEGPEGKSGSTWIDGVAVGSYVDQYGTGVIGAPAAHGLSTGLAVTVAVLDTGVDAAHPQLAGRVLSGGYDFVDDDTNTEDVGDGVDNDGDLMTDELAGHGTFVAGLIALVAPDAWILPVRVLDSEGVGDEWDLTKGLYFAIDRGVEVINMSLGSTYDTKSVKQAIIEAATRGIVVTASAGNLDRDCPREYPAMDDVDPEEPFEPPLNIPGAIGVAATDPADVKAPFSSYSRRLFISAPGDVGADPNDPASSIVSILPDNRYGAWEGTSFANAFVSGTLALVRSQHPEWPGDLNTYLVQTAIISATATDIYPQNPLYAPDMELGAGRVAAGGAVALGPPAPTTIGDLNNDGGVNFADVLLVIADWGLTHSAADLNADGIVGFADILVAIGNWG
ncbi:MAG: S8 family serine peptidase [Planctomycetota bacterium]